MSPGTASPEPPGWVGDPSRAQGDTALWPLCAPREIPAAPPNCSHRTNCKGVSAVEKTPQWWRKPHSGGTAGGTKSGCHLGTWVPKGQHAVEPPVGSDIPVLLPPQPGLTGGSQQDQPQWGCGGDPHRGVPSTGGSPAPGGAAVGTGQRRAGQTRLLSSPLLPWAPWARWGPGALACRGARCTAFPAWQEGGTGTRAHLCQVQLRPG